MTKRPRRNQSPASKTKSALTALKGDKASILAWRLGSIFAGLLWASLVQAEEKWIITHSEREAWIAHELADEVRRVTAFPVGVYRSSNGWLAVAVGPFSEDDVNAGFYDLMVRHVVPEDSRIVGSGCCVEEVVKPSSSTNPVEVRSREQESEFLMWALLPELTSWSEFASSVEALSETMTARANEIGAPPHSYFVGSAANELHGPEHQCLVLAMLLGIDIVADPFVQKYPNPAASTDGETLRFAAHSLSNLHFTIERLLPMGEDRWKHDWNLGCAGREELTETAYIDPSTSAFYDVEGMTLRILGDVEEGFAQRVLDALNANPEIETVALGSGGGYVYEALAAGEVIRNLGLTTRLYNDCMSACTLVFIAGVNREIWSPYPSLGFHMASVDGVEVHPGDSVYQDIRQYTDWMGISGIRVVGLMMKAGASDMHFPSLGELSEMGAVTWCQRMAC